MLLLLSEEHKEHLSFLTQVDSEVVKDINKVAQLQQTLACHMGVQLTQLIK